MEQVKMKLFVLWLSVVISPRTLCSGNPGYDENMQDFRVEGELIGNIVKREKQNRWTRSESSAENAKENDFGDTIENSVENTERVYYKRENVYTINGEKIYNDEYGSLSDSTGKFNNDKRKRDTTESHEDDERGTSSSNKNIENNKSFENNQSDQNVERQGQHYDRESQSKGSSNKKDASSSDDSGRKSDSISNTGKVSGSNDSESNIEGSSNTEKIGASKDSGSISDGSVSMEDASSSKGSGSNTDGIRYAEDASSNKGSGSYTDGSSYTGKVSGSKESNSESSNSDDSRSKGDGTSEVKKSNDSDKYVCFKDGEKFKLGLFVDPQDNCSICECCNSGLFTCAKIKCALPECGKNLQTLSEDGCCPVCKPVCKNVNCSNISCRKQRHAYGPNDCCPQCGCARDAVPAVLPGKFGHWCEDCYCFKNGTVRCNRPECPLERLTCVDMVYTKHCTHTCPNGKTCRRGDDIIKYGQVIEHQDKYCTCSDRMWYTRGFCAKMSPTDKRLAVLQKYMCVAPAPKLT